MRENLHTDSEPSKGRRPSGPASFMSFKPRKTRGVSTDGKRAQQAPVEIAFQKIKEMMYNNELATRFNMSITPIIQALNRLQYLNLVYSKPNRGYYVGEADPANADELFAAREALEIFAMPIVIRNLTAENLNNIRKALDSLAHTASARKYRRALMFADAKFHLSIIKCAGNKVIYDLSRWVFEQIYLKYKPEYLREERIKESGREHALLLNAVAERDVKKATHLLRQHIRNGRKHIVGSLLEDKKCKL